MLRTFFLDASGLAEVVCAVVVIVLSVTGIKSRSRALLLSRSRKNLAMSRVLRSCLQADHADVMVDSECLLITKLQLVASHQLIIFIMIVFQLFNSSGQVLATNYRPGLQCDVLFCGNVLP